MGQDYALVIHHKQLRSLYKDSEVTSALHHAKPQEVLSGSVARLGGCYIFPHYKVDDDAVSTSVWEGFGFGYEGVMYGWGSLALPPTPDSGKNVLMKNKSVEMGAETLSGESNRKFEMWWRANFGAEILTTYRVKEFHSYAA